MPYGLPNTSSLLGFSKNPTEIPQGAAPVPS